jgi:hypothetical protein
LFRCFIALRGQAFKLRNVVLEGLVRHLPIVEVNSRGPSKVLRLVLAVQVGKTRFDCAPGPFLAIIGVLVECIECLLEEAVGVAFDQARDMLELLEHGTPAAFRVSPWQGIWVWENAGINRERAADRGAPVTVYLLAFRHVFFAGVERVGVFGHSTGIGGQRRGAPE